MFPVDTPYTLYLPISLHVVITFLFSNNKSIEQHVNIPFYHLPDDQCRVWLFPLPKQPYSNYINASYIDGFRTRKAYIATQSPLTQTMADYWRMVGCLTLNSSFYLEDICKIYHFNKILAKYYISF